MRIEPLDPTDRDAVALVATRMRATLQEVLGPDRGAAMYTLDWLEDRVRQHLGRDDRAVLLAVDDAVVGHTIVRMEPDALGLVSTTRVHPDRRRHGVAAALLEAGSAFLVGQGARTLATWTDADNTPLIALYERAGFAVDRRDEEHSMVRLARRVGG